LPKDVNELLKQLETVYICSRCGRRFRLARDMKYCPSCGGRLIKKYIVNKESR